jgi:hypothetical protein
MFLIRQSFIDFLQTFFAQAITVMFFQIGFCGVFEPHFHAPAIDGMHAFELFSATGTIFFHRQKARSLPKKAPQKEYQLFKQHCTGE